MVDVDIAGCWIALLSPPGQARPPDPDQTATMATTPRLDTATESPLLSESHSQRLDGSTTLKTCHVL